MEVFNPQNYIFRSWVVLLSFSAILVCFLGVFVYLKNRRAPINIIFGLINLCLAVVFGGVIFVLSAKEDWLVIWWDRLVYMGGVLFFPLLYHFGLAFCKIRGGIHNKILIFNYSLFALFALVLIFAPGYFLNGVYRYVWGAHAKAALFCHIFMAQGVVVAIAFLATIYSYFRKTARLAEKQQAKYLFLAFFILAFCALSFLTAYGVGTSYPLVFLAGTTFSAIVAFTIIRYRLMEIETVIHKTVLWITTSILVLMPISVILLFLWPWLKGLSPWASGAIIIFSFFGFLWYYRRIQPRIDHFFQRRRFDPYQVLFRVVSKVSAEEELEGAVATLNSELKTYLYSRNLVTYIQDEQTGEYKLEQHKGYEEVR